ncbi:MAG TPA: FG-GAP-like repeat-containing protein [Verrucomicrobiae bacterium]
MKTKSYILIAGMVLAIIETGVGQPFITQQPTNFLSVSLGATTGNRVVATGTPPLSYQWRLNSVPLPGRTQSSIVLTDIRSADAGDYDVVVTNSGGSVTSKVATLTVDPTFSKIARGVIVTDLEGSSAGLWADYDNDLFPDLFVANNWANNRNTLYHNDRGTNFSRVNAAPFATDYLQAWSADWGDYDNDGWPDLVVAGIQPGITAQRPYRNNAGKSFSVVLDPGLVSDRNESCYPLWLDYNRDGFLDLFVTKGRWNGTAANDCLFQNQRDGTFKRMTTAEVGPIVNDQSKSDLCSVTDLDDDGYPELTVVQVTPTTAWNSVTWRCQADGTFVTMPSWLPEGVGTPWCADYNNDGLIDFMGTGWWDRPPQLYRNLGAGGFSNVTTCLNMIVPQNVTSGAWGDYDNDGWLDLFCVGYGSPRSTSSNLLFHANGDGTFTQILTGSPIYDGDRAIFPSWVDYDNDGFLDLFIAMGDVFPRNNLLYHNNGNSNHWLKIRLDGVASNRSGIGARIRALATVNGRTFWQVRDIGHGNAAVGPNSLVAHFGLGDATNVTTLEIKWPSGIVQTLSNVATNQFLTVREHQEYPPGVAPALTNVIITTSGLQLSIIEPAAPAVYALEASTNLVTWTKLLARTSAGGTFAYTDARATNYTRRFYRVVVP